MTKFEPLNMTEELLNKRKREAEESGRPATFLDAEFGGGPGLANLLDQFMRDDPEMTLSFVQLELQNFVDIITDYQTEYGEDAPLSLIQ